MGHRKEIRRALRRPFETGGFILLRRIIPLMPRCAVVCLCRLLGNTAVLLPLREKNIGLKNLDAVFGESKTDKEKRAILASSFATFCQTMLDVFWFSVNSEKRMRKYVSFKEAPFKDSLFEDKPAVCITAHLGSWEIMGQTMAFMGVDLASIAATVKNKTVDRILIEQREKTGQTIIPQKGALKTLIARFRKNGKAAFVLDQNTDEKDGGIVVDFLGLPMSVSPAPAMLSYRTGTRIIFGFCLPLPGGYYEVDFSHEILPPPFDKTRDTDAVILSLTQQIEDIISDKIRANPQYWLWSYKHWRRTAVREYPPNFPDY